MKMKWWKSLRFKIIAWSFVPTVIILSAVAWFTFYSYQKVLGDLAIKQDKEVIQDISAKALDAINGKITPIILPIFLDPNILRTGPLDDRAENILANIQGEEVFDGGIYFLDGQGVVYKTIPEQPELIGQDWSNDQAYRFLQEHNNSTFPTDIFTLGKSGNKVVCTALAMIGAQAQTEGSVYLCYAINSLPGTTLNTILSNADLGKNIFILDSKHQVIYSPDLAEIGKDLSGESYLQELLQTESQSGRFKIGNEDILASYVAMFNVPGYSVWGMMKEQSWSEIMQPTITYQRLLLVLLALGVIVPVGVTAYGVRHITNPLQKLIHAAEQVTAGQFKQRIEVKTGDEIETLADEFNLMSEELDESYTLLENKVADRTRELAIINAILSVASRSLDLQEILGESLSIIIKQMVFPAGAAFILDPDRMNPLLATQLGFDKALVENLTADSFMKSLNGLTDRPSNSASFATSDVQEIKLRSNLEQSGLGMLVYVPLSSKGKDLGFFILGKPTASPLSPEEFSLLNSIGQQIGVAIENARLYEQAEKTAIAAERNRLARELHDAVTQTLFSANLIADVIPRIWKRNPEEGLKHLEELRELTRGALAEMRTLLLEMRPESLERADIKSLITQLVDAFIGRVRVPVSLEIEGDYKLTQDVKLVFYRVAQEALNNIAKHAGARQVEVYLECQPEQVKLAIKDDGLGFERASITPDHLGMAIMQERANSIGARLVIDSQVGTGTNVELSWNPLREEKIDE
jgi:nitrate/nitrite-specific signal transduction histidine kinase